MSREALEAGAWRGRAALVAVAGCVGRCAPLLLAHLLDGGRLLALCSDLLHTVLPYYKTAEVIVYKVYFVGPVKINFCGYMKDNWNIFVAYCKLQETGSGVECLVTYLYIDQEQFLPAM